MYLGVRFLFVSTPSPCGHSPYILLHKTQGEVYIPFSSAVSRSITRYFCFLYRRYLKLLLCVAPAIGEVSRREGGGENDISSVCLFSSPVVSHNGIGGVFDGRED